MRNDEKTFKIRIEYIDCGSLATLFIQREHILEKTFGKLFVFDNIRTADNLRLLIPE